MRAGVRHAGVVLVVEPPQVVVHALAPDRHLKPLPDAWPVPHRPSHAFVPARLGAVGQELVGGGVGAVGWVAWHGGDVHGDIAEVQGAALMAHIDEEEREKQKGRAECQMSCLRSLCRLFAQRKAKLGQRDANKRQMLSKLCKEAGHAHKNKTKK